MKKPGLLFAVGCLALWAGQIPTKKQEGALGGKAAAFVVVGDFVRLQASLGPNGPPQVSPPARAPRPQPPVPWAGIGGTMQLDRRLVGWGLIFILIGAVPLAVNAGWLDSDLVSRWIELWPLVIVAIGVSILLSRTQAAWVGTLGVALVFGSMVGGLVATGFHGFPGINGCGGGTANAFQTQSGTLGSSGRLTVEFDCGKLTLGTASGSSWQLAGKDGDGRAPEVSTVGDQVVIRSISDPGHFFNRGKVAQPLINL